MGSTESIRELAEPAWPPPGLELWDVEITARRGPHHGATGPAASTSMP